MGAEFHQTTLRLKGPWHLRQRHLRELDEILSNGFANPNSAGSPATAGDASTAYGPPIRRKLDIFLDNQKTLSVNTFAEAIKAHALERPLARGFKYEASDGNVTATVWVEDNEKQKSDALTPNSDHELFVRVTPQADPTAQSLFSDLHTWATGAQLRIAERTFERYAGWLVILAFVAWTTLSPDPVKPSVFYKNEARALLAKEGALDQAAALRLLLAIAADAPVPAGQPVVFVPKDARYYTWALIAVFSALATAYVIFSPSTLLGVGRGQDRIAAWGVARKAFWAIPALVVINVMLPHVGKAFGFG
jgi:hypothetical protein